MNTKNSKENLALKLAKDYIEVEQIKPLQIAYVKVDDIYPNDYNPNTHDADSFDLAYQIITILRFHSAYCCEPLHYADCGRREIGTAQLASSAMKWFPYVSLISTRRSRDMQLLCTMQLADATIMK